MQEVKAVRAIPGGNEDIDCVPSHLLQWIMLSGLCSEELVGIVPVSGVSVEVVG